MEKKLFEKIELGAENKNAPLDNLLGKNFSPEKTISLANDVDEYNNQKEIINHKIFWTEFINPETKETVEGKVYFPREGKIDKVLIIEPGYRGDFVLQEAMYADDFAKNGRAVFVLRHNGLRVEGDDVKNYVHCPDKTKFARNGGQKYLGQKDFDFTEANSEVLTLLKSLSNSVDQIKNIDIIGHSWGGNIALRSIIELQKQVSEKRGRFVVAENLVKKLNNLILVGAWLETGKDAQRDYNYADFFKGEENGDYFKRLNAEKTMRQIEEGRNELEKIKADDLPQNLRVEGISSVGDEEINILKDIFGFFRKLKGLRKKGQIVLKELKTMMPNKIGDRKTEDHDYALKLARNWIKMIIDKDKIGVSDLLNN